MTLAIGELVNWGIGEQKARAAQFAGWSQVRCDSSGLRSYFLRRTCAAPVLSVSKSYKTALMSDG